MLGDAESVSFLYGGALFSAVKTIDHRQDFVRTGRGITAEVAVIHLQDQGIVAYLAAEKLRNVVGAVVQAIEGANDLQIAKAGSRTWKSAAGNAAVVGKLAGVDARALPVGKLPHLPARVTSRNAESLAGTHRRIAA